MKRLQIPEAEKRLVLIAALKAIGPATDGQLMDFLDACQLMGYVDIQLNLSRLAEEHQVETVRHPLGPLYQPTEEGLFVLASYRGRVPRSRLDILERNAPAYADRFRLERQAPLTTRMTADHRLILEMRLMEEGARELLLIQLTLAGSAAGAALQERWQQAAAGVYAGILRLLSTGSAGPDDPLPEGAETAEAPGEGRLLTLSLETPPPALRICLPFASERLARDCAAAWPAKAQEIKRLVTGAVTGPA